MSIATGCTTCPLCGRRYDDGDPILKKNIADISELTGTATYLDRITMHPSAELEVRLWRLSTPSGKPELVAESIIKRPEKVPVKFRIPLEYGKILNNQEYGVTARIAISGETLFTTDTQYLVLTGNHPSSIQLVLMRETSAPQNSKNDAEFPNLIVNTNTQQNYEKRNNE